MKTKLPVIFLTFANDKVDDALYLRNLPKELHSIRTALVKAEKAGLCEIIERTAATVDDIFNTFQDERYKDRIAIFHYGGHASGNQLMLETLDGGHGASHSDGLVPFLGRQKGLQLVFFNGCSSQAQALELSEAGVGAVVGTATSIKDEIATELAGRFYNGLSSGHTIYESWLEAIDILKTKNDTKKRKGLKLRRDKGNDFPWNMYIRDGAEIVKEWNLPDASQNPLFGLPELPKVDLPEEPFRFLRRYQPEHAEIFFGRSNYIRQLHDRITSEIAAPVILFYGQSGAGKSSTLDSGLLPRLQQEADVKYIRRNTHIGLLGTLDEALGGNFKSAVINTGEGEAILVSDVERQIQYLDELKVTLGTGQHDTLDNLGNLLQEKLGLQNMDIDIAAESTRLERWLSIEAETQRPFHILLDQVEECYTRYNPDLDNELEQFLLEIQQIFIDTTHRPKGKIILSYRKEYHPEIDELCKKLQIPREGIFLKKLGKSDIESVVNGINSTDRLRHRYHINVEPELPIVIADDLLEDKDSPIAPVLSILLTKLWDLAQKENASILSVAQYQELKKEGILMEDFFQQQMAHLHQWKPEFEASGLALDVLNFHTTTLGTAGSQSLENLRIRYEHQENVINDLLGKFKELYLLTDAGHAQTGLAHDTLAPIIIKEIRQSDKIGQRAFRILSSKMSDFQNDKTLLLDKTDLSFVESGKNGMRLWTDLELELITASAALRDKQLRQRKLLNIAGIVVSIIIIGLLIFSFWSMRQTSIANKSRDSAQEAQKKANVASEEAKLEKEKAEMASMIAQMRVVTADSLFIIAREGYIRANEVSRKAQIEKKEAERASLEAKKQLNIAEEETVKAKMQSKRATIASEMAQKQQEMADTESKKAKAAEMNAIKQLNIAEEEKEKAKMKSQLAKMEREYANKKIVRTKLENMLSVLSLGKLSNKEFIDVFNVSETEISLLKKVSKIKEAHNKKRLSDNFIANLFNFKPNDIAQLNEELHPSTKNEKNLSEHLAEKIDDVIYLKDKAELIQKKVDVMNKK
ncbi:MAG: hypothetical protein ACPGXZ_06670 [Saprospiraceae bacterium]